MSYVPEWEVLLSGNPQDLRQCTQGPCSKYFSIYGGVDDWNDCPNDDFRLASAIFNKHENASEVYAISNNLLKLFQGATNLFGYTPWNYKIDNILHNGVPVSDIDYNLCIGAPPNSPSWVHLDDDFNLAKKSDIRYALLIIGLGNQDAWSILNYLSEKPSWSIFSKIMDAIAGYSKYKNIAFNIDPALIKSFNNTANNFSISWLDARHGFEFIKNPKQNKTPIMTFEQAVKFILETTYIYFSKAYPMLR